MFRNSFSLFYWILALGAIVVAIRVFLHFKFKREKATFLRKRQWEIRLLTIYTGVIIYLLTFYLPTTSFYTQANLEKMSQPEAIQQIVETQKEMGEDLDQLRDVCSFVFLAIALYFFGVSGIFRMKTEEFERNFGGEPESKKPLGL